MSKLYYYADSASNQLGPVAVDQLAALVAQKVPTEYYKCGI